jgi:hypothetical protein
MAKLVLRKVRVRWFGPYSVDAVQARKGASDDRYGLYQIYGNHVVFGPGALLYVGMARDQTYAKRFSQHHSWLKHEQKPAIHLGLLEKDDYVQEAPDWPDWRQLLGDVEALTIFWHSPPYNSKNIVRYDGQPLHVQNWGERGRLLPEYSSHWPGLVPRPEPES